MDSSALDVVQDLEPATLVLLRRQRCEPVRREQHFPRSQRRLRDRGRVQPASGGATSHRARNAREEAVQPLLDHRPKLQGSIQGKIDKAKLLKPTEGAFVLREALDEIQNEIAPSPKKPALWTRLGGEDNVRKIVDDFIAIVIEDPKANFLRDKKVKLDEKGMKHLKQVFVELISVNTGGPISTL